MKYKNSRKIISFISCFSLVLQTFLPLTFAMPAYAVDSTDSATIEPTIAPSVTPEVTVTPSVTPEPTPEVTITPVVTLEVTPTIELSPTATPTPTIEITPEPSVTPEVSLEATPTPEPTPTETQNNSPPADNTSNQPIVTTDKADYAPTDTVQVAGMFFLANTPYTSTVTSSDAGGYSNATNVITDSTGAFFYLNPLDGTYRPNYSIAVTDMTNTAVASTTFSDSSSENIKICHHTSESSSHFYNSENVALNSVASKDDWLNGHGSHVYDIWPTFIAKNGDVINGYGDQLILGNNCKDVDLKATKTNDLEDSNAVVNQSFKWSIKIENIGLDEAVFDKDKIIFLDNLPQEATYGTPDFVFDNVYKGIDIVCTIDSNKTLTCKSDANENNTKIYVNGSLTVSFDVTFPSAGTYVNPPTDQKCQADPDSLVSDPDRTNNNCTNTVTVESVTDTTPPSVTIDPTFSRIVDGYACGVGSAWEDDGIKAVVTNWHDGYILQGRYFIGGGSYGGWTDLTEGLWGTGHQEIVGTTLTYTLMNTGDSPEGSAGWQIRVLDSERQNFDPDVIDTLTYIITNDLTSDACGNQVTECSETQYLSDGECVNKDAVCNDSEATNYVAEPDSTTEYIDNKTCDYPASLTISRSNNASSPLTPGSSVEHTITIKVLGSSVNGLTLTDILPNGFVFDPNSYSVFNGSNDITGTITFEDEYHSPGIWNLGNFNNGDTITIKYTADISSDIQPGVYPDLAWADADNGSIVATGENSEYISSDSQFVGTQVEVVKDQTNGGTYDVEKKVEGQVLGASTSLPATGASPMWFILAFVSLVYGIRLIKSSNKSK